ncbi:MAG: hypothetical protein WCK89_12355, partial [bacterium]
QLSVTNYGTGILTWEWTSRSEAIYDSLDFLSDGNRTNWISGKGTGTWSFTSFVLPNLPGKPRDVNRSLKRIFTYRYQKDRDVSMFEDCAWLRHVVWEPTYALQLTQGTNTAYDLPAPYDTIWDAINEAKAGIFPAYTKVTILADPAADGFFFDKWTGENVDEALGPLAKIRNPTFLMPTYDLFLTATYTTNAPTPQYLLTVVNGSESGNGTDGKGSALYPADTSISVSANVPPAGQYFDRWDGTVWVFSPGEIINPNPAPFKMPGYDIVLTATFTTNAPAPNPKLPSSAPARITGLAVQPAQQSVLPAHPAPGIQTFGAEALALQVVLDFEGFSQTDYAITWSPDLASPLGLWQPLDIQYCKVLGDSANGLRLIRLYVEIPASSPCGFFRIYAR